MTIQNGYSDAGGAIGSAGSSLIIRECNFYTNHADYAGVLDGYDSHITVVSCRFVGNSAQIGGVFYLLNSSTLDAEGCYFADNNSATGGVIYAEQSDINMQSCEFIGNGPDAIAGGAVYLNENGSIDLVDCIASGNGRYVHASSRKGGFLYANGSENIFPTATRCVFDSNEASAGGCMYLTGDVEMSVWNSVFIGNYTGGGSLGGGAIWNDSSGCDYIKFVNCTFVENVAESGQGGAVWSTQCAPEFVNCIVWTNSPSGCAGSATSAVSYSCLQDTNLTGVGNIYQDPKLTSSGWGLKPLSPCVNAGTNLTWGENDTDVEGQPRVVDGRVDIGADEVPTVHYVDVNSAAPSWPYLSWTSAATTIQAAIDAAGPGGFVVVTDGVYSVGSRTVDDETPCRIVLTNSAYVSSVNGPSETVILGQGPLGTNAIRCAYVGEGAILDGFALTNGHTRTVGAGYSPNGGGALCSSNATITGCIISGNSAENGGGVFGGFIDASEISFNSASNGGGVYAAQVYDCSINLNSAVNGGGVYAAVAERSIISSNQAISAGGGAYDGRLRSCAVTHNSATSGGGSYDTHLENCTVVGNSATNGGGAFGGLGLNNILYFNSPTNWSGGVYTNSCSVPLLNGVNNITNDPLFVDFTNANYRLQSVSPCVDAGYTVTWMLGAFDLPGARRVRGPAPEMGAIENDTPPGPLGVSVVIIIDVSGSMYSHIQKVKLAVSNFVNGFAIRDIPVEIAGVRYSDTLAGGGGSSDTPPDGDGFFSDAGSFVDGWLNTLSLQDGGDLPEDGLGALTYALNSTNFSPTYSSDYLKQYVLITDASVKDLEDSDTGAVLWRTNVIAMLQASNVTVHAVREPGTDDVEEIAEMTDGLLFDINDEEYDEIFDTLLDLF